MISQNQPTPGILMRGQGGFVVHLSATTGSAELIIEEGAGVRLATVPVWISPQATAHSLPPSKSATRVPHMIHYPGKAKHPAGEFAPVSWFNDEGIGMLRFAERSKRVIVLTLLGVLRPSHQPVALSRRTRGPSRAADLWLTVAAWCLPAGFTIPDLLTTTAISENTVRGWLKGMVDAGLIANDPLLSATAKHHQYVFIASERKVLADFVRDQWREWRSATGHASLRPTYCRFIAQDQWRDIRSDVHNLCFPSGITVLEGGPGLGPKAWLLPAEQAVPELFLYTTTRNLDLLTKALKSPMISGLLVPPDSASTICVLPDGHPAVRLVHRRQQNGSYAYHWPWGLAALDAIDHPDARVRQAATEAWESWITNQSIESMKSRTRND